MSTGTIIDEIERVPEHLTKCLSMLERWEARASNALDRTKKGHAPDPTLARQLSEITKTSTSMAKEMRAWVGTVTDAIESLSLDDQVHVALSLIQGLSMGDRLKTYNHIREMEAKRADGGLVISASVRAPKMTHSGDTIA